MIGVDIVVTALAAGAAAGLNGAATQAVQDTYSALRESLRRRLAGDENARHALTAEQTESSVWEAELGDALVAAGVHRDDHVLATARHLLALTRTAAPTSRTRPPALQLRDCQAVQVGDGNVQHNRF